MWKAHRFQIVGGGGGAVTFGGDGTAMNQSQGIEFNLLFLSNQL